MTSDIWYYCWGTSCCTCTSSSRFAMARHFSSSLQLSFCFKSLLRPCRRPETTGLLGTDGGERWRWGLWGGWEWGGGGSLKGIITVSPEYVHNHSVKQTGVGREESTFPSVFTSSWSSRLPGASTRSPSEKSRAADHSI